MPLDSRGQKMQPNLAAVSETDPYLFRHATPRVSDIEMPGRYDDDLQLWVLKTDSGFVPIVETSDTNLLDTSTVTKVRQEGDDDDLSSDETIGSARRRGYLAELATKTDVQQESDDQISASGLMEFETRTLNNQEGIDESFPRGLLELLTKTASSVEKDD